MYVPYRIEEFLEQYGPLIVDILLAIPFIRLLRAVLIRSRNRSIARQNRQFLLQLPDELILEILSAVSRPRCPLFRGNRPICRGCFSPKQALVALSMTNKRMRNICAPFIFTHIKVRPRNYGRWRAARLLNAAEQSIHWKQYARSLTVNVDTECLKIRHSTESFSRRLALLLPEYDRIRQLHLVVPVYNACALETAFQKCNLELPSVRTLILGSNLDWVISICPNVEVISTVGQDWLNGETDEKDESWHRQQAYNLIHTAGLAPDLRHFEIHVEWNIDLVETMLQCMPNVQILGIQGWAYDDEIHVLLSILGQFRKLKVLALALPVCLGPGYDSHRYGNTFLGSGGDVMRAPLRRRNPDALFYIGRMVLGKIKGLDELWVGDFDRAIFSVNATGRREIEWTEGFRPIPGELS